MSNQKVKLIVTLGPASHSEQDLRLFKDKGVDLVRINMSHSTLADLEYYINLAEKAELDFVIDTEGSQIRTGDLAEDRIKLNENEEIKIYGRELVGGQRQISLRPGYIVEQLEPGDLIYIDFDALILRVADISTIADGYITAKVVSSGVLGRNKATVIDSGVEKTYNLPVLSDKDFGSIKIGLESGIKYIAASFMRSGEFVDQVRQYTRGKMKIISKIECLDGLNNLDEIINKSDYLLLDRGDLSKEIPLEKIPLAQKIILDKARRLNKGVFVATNLLESMIKSQRPTRAEVNDVVNIILDGAYGLTLSAETAIGKHPVKCVNIINKLIKQTELVNDQAALVKGRSNMIKRLERLNYLVETDSSSSLIPPHGGELVNRLIKEIPSEEFLAGLEKIELDQSQQMDLEQIAIGTFSPIEGFMTEADLRSVLDKMRLASGVIWTVPIILDVSREQADKISVGEPVALCAGREIMAILQVEDKYNFDKQELAAKLYQIDSEDHPGVRWVKAMKPVFLGGKIDLIKRRKSEYKEYELTPKQVRRIFEEKGWSKVVGFHTRNVIHRSHEFIQLKAMEQANCDGLFVHPVIGKKKPGDFKAKYIIEGYQQMMKNFYPKEKVVFATFATFSRYAGPREAIFTALCRKNFGCSHFVVGRDHTGVGDFYHPLAAHDIFDQFSDLGIQPIKFNMVFYSTKLNTHIHEAEDVDHRAEDKLHISGTQARQMFENGQVPPDWFMRPEISGIILESMKNGEEIFVKEEAPAKTGQVVWFTGLSGSGKSTVALKLKDILELAGETVAIIDGDDIRQNQHQHLGFSRADIGENNRLIAELAKARARQYDFVLVPIISPYREDRARARSIIGENFCELFLNCSKEKCMTRDVKGLYQKALAGEIDNLIGFSQASPYEAPETATIEVNTGELTVDQAVEIILKHFIV